MSRVSRSLNLWTCILLVYFLFMTTSCYWINPPSEDESGSMALTEEEMNGAIYEYKTYYLDSMRKEGGLGFIILLNNKELLRRSHEIIDNDIIPYKTELEASVAAEAFIEKLKSSLKSEPTPSAPKNDDLIID